jgi:predicted PurR-regulated permease PerM
LGVSGLLILVFIIVCGNMWGIVGILLAIPLAAIIDFVCRDAIMPQLEERRRRLDSETAE